MQLVLINRVSADCNAKFQNCSQKKEYRFNNLFVYDRTLIHRMITAIIHNLPIPTISYKRRNSLNLGFDFPYFAQNFRSTKIILQKVWKRIW